MLITNLTAEIEKCSTSSKINSQIVISQKISLFCNLFGGEQLFFSVSVLNLRAADFARTYHELVSVAHHPTTHKLVNRLNFFVICAPSQSISK
jgi:hypothetical protein